MPENEPFIGRTLAGRFRVTGYIGEGGMASVYRGVQDEDGRNVAIKVMNADLSKDRKFVRRFRREAKAASMLKHANTVEILEFGVDGETVYLAMECIEGLDLAMVLERDRRLTERRAASVVMQVCSALTVAHAQNIVHRDLKPDNIMITAHPKEKGAELVKVLDFGIAKILDEDEGPMPDPRAEPQSHAPSLLTRVGTIVGTPAYMSPEQGRAEKVDGRTDIYACGVLLYELVTGRTPFGGETPMQVVMRHVNEPPIPPSQYVEIHPKLEAIILKALMKWPAERQQSAAELAKALEAILPELATTKRPVATQGGGAPSVVINDRPPPTAGPSTAAAAPSAVASTDRAGAGPGSAASTARGAPPPTAPATPAGGAPAAAADDDEPSTLIVPDVSAVTAGKGGPAAASAAADKKLVFPTLNIDLPEDLEKAGVSRPGGASKSPTLASTAASPSPAPGAPARTATPAGPSVPAAFTPSSTDEDDDARTLIAQPRPPTGTGPKIDIGPNGSLGLAQTLASEMGEIELPRAPPPAAGSPARPREEAPSRERISTPGPGLPDIGSEPTEAGDRSDGKIDGKSSSDRLGLGATLPLDQAELERVLAAGPPRAPLGSMSEVSSPGAASLEASAPAASSAITPAAPKKGLSVAMAMVLGAVIGAIVVGAIVVALVSMR